MTQCLTSALSMIRGGVRCSVVMIPSKLVYLFYFAMLGIVLYYYRIYILKNLDWKRPKRPRPWIPMHSKPPIPEFRPYGYRRVHTGMDEYRRPYSNNSTKVSPCYIRVQTSIAENILERSHSLYRIERIISGTDVHSENVKTFHCFW